MKRSCSAPNLINGEAEETKKIKTASEDVSNSREYLQLALDKVLELQHAVEDNSYFNDNTSDLGESDTDEEIMREVLTKVFKDLPGSSPTVMSIINRATYPTPRELSRIRAKSVQLSGYDTCRRVAVDFMKNVVKYTPKFLDRVEQRIDVDARNRRRESVSNEYELRTRMLKGLDLHLAAKQRDYTFKLMRL